MQRATALLIGSLILLLGSAATVHALPIVYDISGQISMGGGAFEDFHGSFVLSDPAVSVYDASDSRGDQLDLYAVTDFRLSSASYSLTGYGFMSVWWSLYRGIQPTLNALDSVMVFYTSAGAIDTEWNFPLWEGDPATQPMRFSGLTAAIGLPSVGGVTNMTAHRTATIPEPSTLMLLGAGLGLSTLLQRRVSSGRARRRRA